MLAAERYDASEPVNLGSGEEIAIRDLADAGGRGHRVTGAVRLGHQPAQRPAAAPARRHPGPRAVRLRGPDSASPRGWRRTVAWFEAEFRRQARRPREEERSSPASPARTARTWPSCCWPRATRSTASSAGRARSTPSASTTIYQDPHAPDYRLRLVYGDLDDGSSLANLVKSVRPDEIYNLGAQSHVRVSFDVPEYTVTTVALGTLRLLEAVRELGGGCRFYQASSSEMFGVVAAAAERADALFQPRSPYACAKVFAHHLCQNYREAYGLFICCGILFNHESPRRGIPFVTRKITRAAARIKHGLDRQAVPRQPGRPARLGLRRRLRRGDVADAAAGRSPTTTSSPPASRTRCARCWTWPSATLGLDWKPLRPDRSALLPPHRGRPPAGRRQQGPAASWAGSRRSASRS